MRVIEAYLPQNLQKGLRLLETYDFLKLDCTGTTIFAVQGKEVSIEKSLNKITITYDTIPHFYMALARSFGMQEGKQSIPIHTEKLGFMLDCSRNAVMLPDMVKRLLCLLALTGYNYLELYTEDTYELPGEPYFGYKRGRYNEEELTEMIDFAETLGLDVVPCIQTLAHMKNLTSWKAYDGYMDIDDIMLVGDERVYALIRKSLEFCRRVFHSKRINIGTDEAFHLGRGKYADLHGFRSKHAIYLEHLQKVFALCKEVGFEPEFWGDAFYDIESPTEEIRKLFDGTQTPIYWDYNSMDIEFHKEKFGKLKECTGRVSYAGAFWKWIGYVPENTYSQQVADAALAAGIECDVQDYLMTAWGDNGDECSVFTVLPSMWHAANLLYPCETDVNVVFREMTGYTYDEWQSCEQLNYAAPKGTWISNAAKYLLHNDFLIGLMDYNILDSAGEKYEQLLPVMSCMAQRTSSYAYIFQSYAALCKVLIRKSTYGRRLYTAYQNQDEKGMRALLDEIRIIQNDLRGFYDTMRLLWMKENKGFGFEVLDVRLGGLICRVDTVCATLADYLEGKTKRIYELEEERLDYYCSDLSREEACSTFHGYWDKIYTVNHI